MDPGTFIKNHLNLLAKEREEEIKEFDNVVEKLSPRLLQKRGWALLNLTLAGCRIGLGGKFVAEFTSTNIPAHAIRTGDLVRILRQGSEIKSKNDKEFIEGVVTRVGESKISISLQKDQDSYDFPERCMIIKIGNDGPYVRVKKTMEKLLEYIEDNQKHSKFPSHLIDVLFGKEKPIFNDNSENIEFFDSTLNQSQREAVQFALSADDIALIHGPPGTGKTYTVVEIIRQLVQKGKKVIVCGPSNISVDNIIERLANTKISFVRLGHPARILPSTQEYSLDVLSQTCDAGKLVSDIRLEIDSNVSKVNKAKSGRERHALYGEIKELRKEFRERERKVVQSLISNAEVILATCHGGGSREIYGKEFDVCIIDEASQALEGSCWIPILSSKKLILAGDPLQLPPTIKSRTKKSIPTITKDLILKNKIPLEVTLFDRLVALHNHIKGGITRMLTIQYRFNTIIGDFPSKELYKSKLLPDESVKNRKLTDLQGVQVTEDTESEIVFYDTTGSGKIEQSIESSNSNSKISGLFDESKCNEGEVEIVIRHITGLVNAGVSPSCIAILSPYNAQVHMISLALKSQYPEIEIGSIDGMQGREKDAVVISLVRSHQDIEKMSQNEDIVGFLTEKRRLNVAMTRPKRHLCIIGDSETIRRGSKYLCKWVEYLEEYADVRYDM